MRLQDADDGLDVARLEAPRQQDVVAWNVVARAAERADREIARPDDHAGANLAERRRCRAEVCEARSDEMHVSRLARFTR